MPKLIKSFYFAADGFIHVIEYNQNFRIHLIAAALIMLLAFVFRVSQFELFLLLMSVIFVIMAELINTAIEEITNLITLEHRREAKIAKDVGAASVLTAVIFAIVVGIIVLGPRILNLFLSKV